MAITICPRSLDPFNMVSYCNYSIPNVFKIIIYCQNAQLEKPCSVVILPSFQFSRWRMKRSFISLYGYLSTIVKKYMISAREIGNLVSAGHLLTSGL